VKLPLKLSLGSIGLNTRILNGGKLTLIFLTLEYLKLNIKRTKILIKKTESLNGGSTVFKTVKNMFTHTITP
jgi:hypothetical protein